MCFSGKPLLAILIVAGAAITAGASSGRADDFQISFAAGSRDEAGLFAGGTEIRVLTPHGGRLYAGNGYWEDRPGTEGRQGAQILVLDAPGGRWRVDHAFKERLPNGRWRDLAVGALAEAIFATDGFGRTLPQPISLLLASTWDLTGAARVFARDDATGAWPAVTLASYGLGRPDNTGRCARWVTMTEASSGWTQTQIIGSDRPPSMQSALC
jgi:hypothetical protein